MSNNTFQPEIVGRKYSYTKYGVLSRRIGGNGKWYGIPNSQTEEAAREEMRVALRGNRIVNVGGITVDFGGDDGERFERKLVRIECNCEVLATGVGPV